MKHTVCGPMQTTSAEMQTKFIAVERRVKMKGHEQEEEYEYVVWAEACLFVCFIIEIKIENNGYHVVAC